MPLAKMVNFIVQQFSRKGFPNQHRPSQDVKTESVSAGVTNKTDHSGFRKGTTFLRGYLSGPLRESSLIHLFIQFLIDPNYNAKRSN